MADPFIRQYDRDGNLILATRSAGYQAITCLGARRFLLAYNDGTTARMRHVYLKDGERQIQEITNVASHAVEGCMFDGKHVYFSVDPTGIGVESIRKMDWGGNVLDTFNPGTGRRDHAWQRQSLGRYVYGNRYLKINQTPAVAGSKIEIYARHLGNEKLVRSVAISLDNASGVCTDGRIYYVVDTTTNIYAFDLNGNLIRTILTPGVFLNVGIDFDGKYFYCVGS